MTSCTFQAPAGFAGTRLMVWLRDRLAVRGVTAVGPLTGYLGAGLRVNAEDGFVSIRLGRAGRSVAVIVERLGEADDEYDDTVAACEDALAGARMVSDLSA